MFESKIELVETENTTERIGASHSQKEINENGPAGAVNSSPQGVSTDFQKFAAGAAFATPSGSEIGPAAQKKPGRPRKHPKKNSTVLGHSQASSVDHLLTRGPEKVEEQKKKFVSMAEITAPCIRVLGAIAAQQAWDKRWSLSKDESEEIAKSLDKVLNEFIPDMENLDPKTAAVVGLCMTIGSIYAVKYQDVMKSSKPVETAQAPTEAVQTEPKKPEPEKKSEQFNSKQFGVGPLG